MATKRRGKRHIVIPDAQVKPGVNTDHLEACGNYIAVKQPDTIVCLGDWADMPSLMQQKERGHIDFENKRYHLDLIAAYEAMERMMNPVERVARYKPRKVMILGNHEQRITRLTEQEPMWQGTISIDDLGYDDFGWEVIPFLKPKKVDGILYSHYFVTGKYDTPIARAQALLTKLHQSCIAGHQQGRDIAYAKNAEGKPLTAIIAGSFYSHKEDYMSHQSNNHWRGIYMLNEVGGGSFDEMAVSLNFLKRRYL